MPRLKGKLCPVTVAARCIGEAFARTFGYKGGNVIATDINELRGQTTVEAIDATFDRLDVASEADWVAMADLVPHLDVLVNNAGVTGFEGPFQDRPPLHDPENAILADWRTVHVVNLDGTFLGCHYAFRAMRAKGTGSIISISSRSGMLGVPGAAAYASSKAGIRNHTKSVALDCAAKRLNVRCNSIHPAAVMTPMWKSILGDGPDREERAAAMVAETALRRFAQPEEVASLVVLASDEATYITGSELTIDGGILAVSAATPEG